ncbi:MAG: hypothetical protein C0467_19935 [Planctomycetaceae bacterium]|nr:hypothetical protein [Planctomycetaceae bacterium]
MNLAVMDRTQMDYTGSKESASRINSTSPDARLQREFGPYPHQLNNDAVFHHVSHCDLDVNDREGKMLWASRLG